MTRPINLSPILRGVAEPEMLRHLAEQGRPALERFIEAAIAALDVIDGDADDQDGNGAEDDECAWFKHPEITRGAVGCPIADPGGGNVEDEAMPWEVQAYAGPIATASSRNLADER